MATLWADINGDLLSVARNFADSIQQQKAIAFLILKLTQKGLLF